jgi:hypothetical protein
MAVGYSNRRLLIEQLLTTLGFLHLIAELKLVPALGDGSSSVDVLR